MDLALVYDGFTFNAISWIEGLGFCGFGEAYDWLDGGRRIALDGDLPVNPHGGQLSEGRTHGFGFFYEAVAQLRHEAGERQVRDAAHGGGHLWWGHALGRPAAPAGGRMTVPRTERSVPLHSGEGDGSLMGPPAKESAQKEKDVSNTRPLTTEKPSGPRSRKGIETRARLVSAAKEVFEESGFLDARISDIAERAGLSHGSFYHYFESKEEVFREVAAEVDDRLSAPLDSVIFDSSSHASPAERIRQAIRLNMESYRDEARIMGVIEQVSRFDQELSVLRAERQEQEPLCDRGLHREPAAPRAGGSAHQSRRSRPRPSAP